MRTITLLAGLAVLGLATTPVTAQLVKPPSKELVAKLCNGGEIRIPLKSSQDEDEPHCPEGKGCHAGICRKGFDPAQRLKSD